MKQIGIVEIALLAAAGWLAYQYFWAPDAAPAQAPPADIPVGAGPQPAPGFTAPANEADAANEETAAAPEQTAQALFQAPANNPPCDQPAAVDQLQFGCSGWYYELRPDGHYWPKERT